MDAVFSIPKSLGRFKEAAIFKLSTEGCPENPILPLDQTPAMMKAAAMKLARTLIRHLTAISKLGLYTLSTNHSNPLAKLF